MPWKKIIKRFFQGLGIVFVIGIVYLLCKQPSLDREWKEEQAVVPTATIEGNQVIIHNYRNFTYQADETPNIIFEDKQYDLNDITGVDFFISYFSDKEWIAHPFVSFQFANQEPMVISIEARYEKGETYSPLLGIFRKYEEYYALGSERDIVGLRTHIRQNGKGEEVYLYQGRTTPEKARKMLLSFLEKVNDLAKEPQWYNTIRSNCVNLLADHVRDATDKNVPWSYKMILAGYADEMAYDLGFFDTSIAFEELKSQSRLDIQHIAIDDPEFSKKIRE